MLQRIEMRQLALHDEHVSQNLGNAYLDLVIAKSEIITNANNLKDHSVNDKCYKDISALIQWLGM